MLFCYWTMSCVYMINGRKCHVRKATSNKNAAWDMYVWTGHWCTCKKIKMHQLRRADVMWIYRGNGGWRLGLHCGQTSSERDQPHYSGFTKGHKVKCLAHKSSTKTPQTHDQRKWREEESKLKPSFRA